MTGAVFALDHVRIADLPPFAWLAEVDRAAGRALILAGPRVETKSHFFAEGVWNGPFEAGGFDRTEVFFGSGAVATAGALTFVPSAGTTDWLHHAERGGRLFVANSLPLLLARLDDRLDLAGVRYDEINDTIRDGIERYTRTVPTRDGGVTRLLFHNLRVTRSGAEIAPKGMPPDFTDYAGYVDYVAAAYRSLARNARDPARARPLSIYSTQSKGYDSTAVNAIARGAGLDAVFTVTRGKAAGRFVTEDAGVEVDDDGTEICRILGIPVVPIDRRAFETDFADEALFHAGLHLCQDANLLAIGRRIDNAGLLLTGVLGEIWYTEPGYREHMASLNPDLERWDLSGHGLGEARLAMGLVQVPVPFIGGRRRAEIFRISTAAEMAPWRLGVAYDRPIARRLGEEAGVPRAAFGQRKMASVTQFPEPPVPNDPALRDRYFDAIVGSGLVPRWYPRIVGAAQRVNARILFDSTHRFRAVYYAERLADRLGRPGWTAPTLYRRLNGTLHAFCVNERTVFYRSILDRAERARRAA